MNHQNSILKNLPLSSDLKIIRTLFFIFIVATLIVGGFFASQQAFASAVVTTATNGTNVSIDTTSAASGTGIYKTLSGPGINELAAGDIATGVHTITLPAGWEFEISTINISTFGSDIAFASTSITPSATSFSFEVTSPSTTGGFVGFGGIKVRPTGTTPSVGNMTYSGDGIVGVDGNTNFGTLSTVAGTVTKLAFTTEPGNAVYGSLLSTQPVVKTQDQFGNNSTSGLIETEMVSLSLTGTGVLQGTASLNIGTGGDTPGTVTFTDLKVGGVDAIGTKGLTASAGTLTNAVSDEFFISPKPLTATVTVNNKPYDGNNSAVITGVTLNGVETETGDDVTVSNNGTVTFASPNANIDIVVTSNGVIIAGAHAGNYSFDNTATGVADIIPLGITITPDAGQSKVYGDSEPVFAYTFDPVLIGGDGFTGALSRVAGENVGTYAYEIGSLTAGPNYALTFVSGTFEITQKPLTVTAIGINREYDQTINAIVTLSSADEESGDGLVYAYTSASFMTKTAENGKTVSVSGISISGAKAGNYGLQNTEDITTANITKKSITATLNLNNKTYDGDTGAVYSSTNPRVANGVIEGDVVVIVNTGSKAFVDKHVGVSKMVNAVGLTLSGADAGNYDFDGTGTGTATINPRPITVTAQPDIKIYNGTTGSDETPAVTSTFSPAVALVDTANFTQTYDNKNVGTLKILTPSGTVNDNNGGANYSYTFVTDATGVITAKSINVTAQPDTKIYDGTTNSSVVPIVGALEVGDTITTAPTQSYDTKDFGTGKTLIPSGLVVNDDNGGLNYSITNVNNTTGEIEKKNLTVSGAATNSKTYDGDVVATVNFASAGLVGVVPGEEALVSLNSTGYSAIFDNKNVATGKTVTVLGLDLTGVGASNYSLTQPILNYGVITKRALTVTATSNTKTYDGLTTAAAIPIITVGSLASGDIGTFTETYDNANVGAAHTLTPAGTIVDAGGIDMTGNYDITFTPIATGVIEKAPLTITADNKSRIYGDANPTLTASYNGFVNSENENVLDTPVSLSTLADETSPVGDYSITASGAVDANYEIIHSNGILTVNPAPIDITPDNLQGKIYGDPDEEITYTASGFKNGQDKSLFTGALGREEGENADEYPITIGTLDVGDNYYVVDSFFDVFYTIEQRELTVTAVTDTKTYDGNTTSNETSTITGELQFSDAPAFTQSYDNKNVGTNKILTPSGVVNDGNGGANYSYDFSNTAVGEITPLEITITPTTGQTKIYGQTDPTFAYTFNPALISPDSPDSFSGALGRDAGNNVGTYVYTLGTLSAGGNYLLTLGGTETFAITKETPIITWSNPADIVYGTALSGTELNATADVDGTFVYTPISGTVLNAGVGQTLSVTFTPTDTANYNNANKNVLITVIPKSLTITADNKFKVLNSDDPTLTYDYTGLVNEDTEASFTGGLVRTPGEDIGSYSINQGNLSAIGNYNVGEYVSGTLTIKNAPTVVSHTPSFNAINVSPAIAIVVTFSEAVVVEEGDVSFSPIISGGFTISNSGTSVVTITPNDLLEDNTTYTITLDGVADINGLPLSIYNNIKFTTATNYSINLNVNASGWNLISLPVVPSNTSIAAVLGSAADNIDAVWTYDPTNLSAVNGWFVFVPGNPEDTNNLTLMTTGFGYWISVTSDTNFSGSGTILIAGPIPPPSRSLQTGWNLIGYYQLPNETNSNPASAFASIGESGVGYNGLWGFDNTIGLFKPVTTILPGDAFWISLPSVKIYTPSNL